MVICIICLSQTCDINLFCFYAWEVSSYTHHNFRMKSQVMKQLSESPVSERVHEYIVRVTWLVTMVLIHHVMSGVLLVFILEEGNEKEN